MDVKDAKVLITGGSSGLGYATAELLKSQGAQVVISARNEDKLSAAAKALGVESIVADVAEEQQVIDMVAKANELLGGLNVLINNAGYGYVAPLLKTDATKFEEVWRTNVLGLTLVAREAAKLFVAQDYGNIVNIASTSGLKGSPNAGPYTATKFAVRGLTESWRNELRPHNIRVMLVNPSEVMTHFATNVMSPVGQNERKYSEAEQATKLRGEEIAHTISSLLQMDDRGFVTEATVFATNPQV